jgi:hypothetical protein
MRTFLLLIALAFQTLQLISEQTALGYTDNADYDGHTDSSSEDDEWNTYNEQQTTRPAIWRSIRRIEEDTRSLFQVSLIIARSGFRRQYIHSTKEDNWDPRVAHYADFDLRHVEEKVLDWRCVRHDEETEPIATSEVLQSRSVFPTLLIRRLARSNTKRREQIFYWEKFPDQPPLPDQTTVLAKGTSEPVEDNKPDIEAQKDEMPPQETKSQAPQSIASKHTFSTAVVSDVFGPRSVAGPARTIYAETVVGRRSSNRVPNVPNSSLHEAKFECPYCHLALDSIIMQNRQQWK